MCESHSLCMTSPSLSNCGILLPLVAALALYSFHSSAAVDTAEVQWKILTKSNYTSQIRLNPRLLVFVTVPWSGESRSLMKEIAHVVAKDQARFGTLKLMVLYRNVERMLADALGATSGITVFYCHDALSYKYGGKLRVQNILSSVQYVMSFPSDELPLTSLTTPNELRDFIDSTDKAVLLFEFCGWTPRLLAMYKQTAQNVFDCSRESNVTLVEEEKKKRKGMGDDKLSCGVDSGFSEISWLSQFTFVNDSFMKDTENLTNSAGDSCTLDEFQHFEAFLQKIIPVIRETFLPPERTKFALIRERSLLPFLNIEEPTLWTIVVSFTTCPSCLKVVREVDDLKTVLLTQIAPVLELEDDLHGDETSLPAKRPTIILFIDRSSDSMQMKRESQNALNAFRELAKQHEMENQISGRTSRSGKTSAAPNRALWSTLKHSGLQLFPPSTKLVYKDKISMMIVNEGQQITIENLVTDLQGISMNEILSYALKQKKELKLSSLAKVAGFQLLSKDFEVEVEESLSLQREILSNHALREPEEEGGFRSTNDLDETQVPAVTSRRSGQDEELRNPDDAKHILLQSKKDPSDKSSRSDLEPEDHHHIMGIAIDNAPGRNKEKRLEDIDESEQQNVFGGSFFFCDGQYRLLETLTGGSKMPSVVIIDPLSQQHYVWDEQADFNHSSLSHFLDHFLHRKLSPHQQSAPVIPSLRSAPRPPFVNLDFHDPDSIPQVTSHSFAELVLGNKSDSKNSGGSWDRNVLVLFSNSWCGFCQKMELVVREVYRTIKGFINMKTNFSRMETWKSTEYVEDIALMLPLIYMMDCTQNDCSLIIKHTQQRELYPLLMLFPAEMKNNTLVYEGDIAVSDIIKFLAAHGSHVLDLIMDERLGLHVHNSVKQGPHIRNLHHEVLLKERLQTVEAKYDQIPAKFPVNSDVGAQLFVGNFLSATEKLLDVHPFDESMIFIVKVDQGTGFQGLIINKHISWDSLEELDEGFQVLKEAPLSFGGPVMRQGMPLVALTQIYLENQSQEVLPNVYFIDPMTMHSLLEEIRMGNRSVHDYWFFLGYSSWGWDQLFLEIAQGAWLVRHGNLEQLKWPRRYVEPSACL